MKPILSLLTILTFVTSQAFAQNESPYKTSFKVDAPIIAAGIGLSYYGLTLMGDKEGMTDAELMALNKNDVNAFDRFSAGYDSESAANLSDIGFYGSFGLPVLMLLNDNVGSKAGQVAVLYVETMAVTGALFTMVNGNVERARPITYSPEADINDKNDGNALNSFYAGHTSATAAASFFAAKIFHDFNPDSRARPYVWAAAAALPATVGYLRLKAGKHFLSDNLLGYGIGAAAGILVPQFHKKSNKRNFTLIPVSGRNFSGAHLTYTF
ncbi:phosphatase PAP2 family protein [Pontibacter akesuensis]|uniref:PAP2 superfamily protein n=1 Tax=Pontibacter akesuensis TaxID=388950 RepID=A0A1I7JKB3_9BACT|nr:phosphatase PAP2 family protein [Pontibacter akesuensis]SFU85622.1 PAP2 superfamily protein [Pontibacter akesuensis]